MKKLTTTGIIVCCVFLLSACCSSPNNGSKNVLDSGGKDELKETTLSDGTRCVVIIGINKAAISCDWKK